MHGVALVLALLGMACLPAVVAAVLCADELIDRFACAWGDWRDRWRRRRTIARLNRALALDPPAAAVDLTEFDRLAGPSIEQLAADLRRLGGQRLGVVSRSAVWQSAVREAYDDRLRRACRCLGIAEHLTDLDGVDRDIERVRIEGQLQAAGLSLPAATTGRRHRQR
ncbi:hypothetical protein [Micromonospora zhanjiangensis]|uniref:Uncharacterized protein n=1 Tax=Micromonospora zhanjiangensis TaxID=1522057 RepID=A0ABV8KNV4_9ACTN